MMLLLLLLSSSYWLHLLLLLLLFRVLTGAFFQECTDGGGRGYPELFYSGVLSKEQTNAIYETLTTSNGSYVTRPVTLGCAGYKSNSRYCQVSLCNGCQ